MRDCNCNSIPHIETCDLFHLQERLAFEILLQRMIHASAMPEDKIRWIAQKLWCQEDGMSVLQRDNYRRDAAVIMRFLLDNKLMRFTSVAEKFEACIVDSMPKR